MSELDPEARRSACRSQQVSKISGSRYAVVRAVRHHVRHRTAQPIVLSGTRVRKKRKDPRSRILRRGCRGFPDGTPVFRVRAEVVAILHAVLERHISGTV